MPNKQTNIQENLNKLHTEICQRHMHTYLQSDKQFMQNLKFLSGQVFSTLKASLRKAVSRWIHSYPTENPLYYF